MSENILHKTMLIKVFALLISLFAMASLAQDIEEYRYSWYAEVDGSSHVFHIPGAWCLAWIGSGCR